MTRWEGRIRAFAVILIFSSCVSTGFRDDSLFNDAEISAIAALGRMDEAISGLLYEGDGGKDIRLAVLAPQLQ